MSRQKKRATQNNTTRDPGAQAPKTQHQKFVCGSFLWRALPRKKLSQKRPRFGHLSSHSSLLLLLHIRLAPERLVETVEREEILYQQKVYRETS